VLAFVADTDLSRHLVMTTSLPGSQLATWILLAASLSLGGGHWTASAQTPRVISNRGKMAEWLVQSATRGGIAERDVTKAIIEGRLVPSFEQLRQIAAEMVGPGHGVEAQWNERFGALATVGTVTTIVRGRQVTVSGEALARSALEANGNTTPAALEIAEASLLHYFQWNRDNRDAWRLADFEALRRLSTNALPSSDATKPADPRVVPAVGLAPQRATIRGWSTIGIQFQLPGLFASAEKALREAATEALHRGGIKVRAEETEDILPLLHVKVNSVSMTSTYRADQYVHVLRLEFEQAASISLPSGKPIPVRAVTWSAPEQSRKTVGGGDLAAIRSLLLEAVEQFLVDQRR